MMYGMMSLPASIPNTIPMVPPVSQFHSQQQWPHPASQSGSQDGQSTMMYVSLKDHTLTNYNYVVPHDATNIFILSYIICVVIVYLFTIITMFLHELADVGWLNFTLKWSFKLQWNVKLGTFESAEVASTEYQQIPLLSLCLLHKYWLTDEFQSVEFRY